MKTARSSLFALALFVAVTGAEFACADTVTYGGVSLSIDSQEDLHDGTIKVVIRGKPSLLPKEGFERGVALHYMTEPELSSYISSGDLLMLITGTLQGGDSEVAVNAIASAIRSRSMSPEAFGDFIGKVAALPGGQGAIEAALRMVGQNVRDQPLCLSLPHTDVDKLVDFDVQLSRASFTSSCYTLLSGEALALFRKGDLSGVKRVLEALVSLRVSDQQVIKDVKKSALIFTQISDAAGQGQYSVAVTALESLRKDPIFGSVAAVGISAVVTKLGEQSLQRGDYAAALYFLTRADFKQRTPQQHLMLSRAIRGLSAASLKVTLETQTQNILMMYAGKDEAVRDDLIEYFERVFKERLGDHDVETANQVIKVVVALRPDPSERNDVLRRHVVDELIALERPQEARLALQQIVVARVPLTLRVWLFASGSLGGLIAVVLSGVVLLTALVCSVVVGRRWYRLRRAVGNEADGDKTGSTVTSANGSNVDDAKHDQGHSRTFVFYPPEFRVSGWRGEYESLLSYFELPSEATLSEIKVAYRKRVKEAHPDRNLTAVGDSSDQFIEISKKYERLLELRDQHDAAGGK